MSQHNDIESLRRFGVHLEQAVHDAHHEAEGGVAVVHFWDDDSLFLPSFGFEELRQKRAYPRAGGTAKDLANRTTRDDVVTQALFAAGYLGPVSMLAPHRVEYFSLIERRMEQKADRPFSKRLDDFLDSRSEELDQLLDVGHELNRLVGTRDPADTKKAIRLLRDIDPWTFVLMENTTHAWPERVKRLLSTGQLIDLGLAELPTSGEILADPTFDQIHEGLVRAGGSHRTVATAIDAAALTSLAILVRRLSEPGASLYPRFYTSSARIRTLFHGEEWFRECLSFKIPGDGGRLRTGTAWRDPYYYQLRARFPSLRPSASRGNKTVGPTLHQLDVLSARVKSAVVEGSAEVDRLLSSSVTPDGRPLLALITALERMGMADIWLTSDPADYAQRWRDGLSAIWTMSTLDLTRQCMSSVYDELNDDTVRSVNLYEVQIDIMTGLARAVTLSKRDRLRNELGDMKNLGLERWGISAPGQSHHPLPLIEGVGTARSLLYWSDPERLYKNPTDLVLTVGLLLSIDEFDLALRVLDPYEGDRTGTLGVMYLAARVRAANYVSDETLATIVNDLFSIWEAISEREKLRLALGFGYVAFHAWRKSSPAIAVAAAPADPSGWADFSRRIVRDRLHEFRRDRLVLALNHIVYVESVAGMEGADSLALVSSLREQAGETRQYRIFDTLGWREYLLLEREGRVADVGAGLSRIERLEASLEDLRTASLGAYRDREVAEHLQIVSEAYRKERLSQEPSVD